MDCNKYNGVTGVCNVTEYYIDTKYSKFKRVIPQELIWKYGRRRPAILRHKPYGKPLFQEYNRVKAATTINDAVNSNDDILKCEISIPAEISVLTSLIRDPVDTDRDIINEVYNTSLLSNHSIISDKTINHGDKENSPSRPSIATVKANTINTANSTDLITDIVKDSYLNYVNSLSPAILQPLQTAKQPPLDIAPSNNITSKPTNYENIQLITNLQNIDNNTTLTTLANRSQAISVPANSRACNPQSTTSIQHTTNTVNTIARNPFPIVSAKKYGTFIINPNPNASHIHDPVINKHPIKFQAASTILSDQSLFNSVLNANESTKSLATDAKSNSTFSSNNTNHAANINKTNQRTALPTIEIIKPVKQIPTSIISSSSTIMNSATTGNLVYTAANSGVTRLLTVPPPAVKGQIQNKNLNGNDVFLPNRMDGKVKVMPRSTCPEYLDKAANKPIYVLSDDKTKDYICKPLSAEPNVSKVSHLPQLSQFQAQPQGIQSQYQPQSALAKQRAATVHYKPMLQASNQSVCMSKVMPKNISVPPAVSTIKPSLPYTSSAVSNIMPSVNVKAVSNQMVTANQTVIPTVQTSTDMLWNEFNQPKSNKLCLETTEVPLAAEVTETTTPVQQLPKKRGRKLGSKNRPKDVEINNTTVKYMNEFASQYTGTESANTKAANTEATVAENEDDDIDKYNLYLLIGDCFSNEDCTLSPIRDEQNPRSEIDLMEALLRAAGICDSVAGGVCDIKLDSEVDQDLQQKELERSRCGWLPKQSIFNEPYAEYRSEDKSNLESPDLQPPEAHLASQLPLKEGVPNICLDHKYLKSVVLDLSHEKVPYIVYMRDRPINEAIYKYEWLKPNNARKSYASSFTPQNKKQSDLKRSPGIRNKKVIADNKSPQKHSSEDNQELSANNNSARQQLDKQFANSLNQEKSVSFIDDLPESNNRRLSPSMLQADHDGNAEDDTYSSSLLSKNTSDKKQPRKASAKSSNKKSTDCMLENLPLSLKESLAPFMSKAEYDSKVLGKASTPLSPSNTSSKRRPRKTSAKSSNKRSSKGILDGLPKSVIEGLAPFMSKSEYEGVLSENSCSSSSSSLSDETPIKKQSRKTSIKSSNQRSSSSILDDLLGSTQRSLAPTISKSKSKYESKLPGNSRTSTLLPTNTSGRKQEPKTDVKSTEDPAYKFSLDNLPESIKNRLPDHMTKPQSDKNVQDHTSSSSLPKSSKGSLWNAFHNLPESLKRRIASCKTIEENKRLSSKDLNQVSAAHNASMSDDLSSPTFETIETEKSLSNTNQVSNVKEKRSKKSKRKHEDDWQTSNFNCALDMPLL